MTTMKVWNLLLLAIIGLWLLLLGESLVSPVTMVFAFHHPIIHPQQQPPSKSQQPLISRFHHPPLSSSSSSSSIVQSMLKIRGGSNNICTTVIEGIKNGRRNSSTSSTTTVRNADMKLLQQQQEPSREGLLSVIKLFPFRAMMGEMTGTFLLVQIGTAAIMSSIFCSTNGGGIGSGGLYVIAILWSIAVTIAIKCTGSISGAHLNPAITIAMSIFRKFPKIHVIPYILSQFIGAMFASSINLVLFHAHIVQFETMNNIIRNSLNAIPSAKAFGEYFVGISTLQAFVVELFGTFILSLVIFSLTHPSHDNDKNTAAVQSVWIPPIIGATVAVLICTLAPFTQAGFNPARDFGPRIIAYIAGWKSVAFYPIRTSWIVYIVGPILGAVLGAAYTDLILYPSNNKVDNNDQSNS